VDGEGGLGPPEDYAGSAIFAETELSRDQAVDLAKPYLERRLLFSPQEDDAEFEEDDAPC